jgi:RNA polymerase sigma-70 factor (ECF subfamily)
MEHSQDLALARRLVTGEARAFAAFFDEYFPRLYRFALARLRSDADAAEEATQRTLCRAVRKFELYRGEASLLTWLCQICRHEMADMLEAQARQQARPPTALREESPEIRARLESLPADEGSDPVALAARTDRQRLVQATLDHLPCRYGDALEWKYIEGVPVEEIARRLEVTPLAAESLLARARRAFRNAWQSVTGEPLAFAEGPSP